MGERIAEGILPTALLEQSSEEGGVAGNNRHDDSNSNVQIGGEMNGIEATRRNLDIVSEMIMKALKEKTPEPAEADGPENVKKFTKIVTQKKKEEKMERRQVMYKLTIKQENFNQVTLNLNKLAEIQAVLDILVKEPGTQFVVEAIEPVQETEEDF